MNEQTEQAPAQKGWRAELMEIARTVGLALLLALAIRTLAFQPFTIPSSSMEPALRTGDYAVVSKWRYGWSRHSILFSPPLFPGRLLGRAPARGDVIVFKLPRDGRTDFVKRLIGLPGDHVRILGGQVWINGAPIAREVLGPGVDADAPGRAVVRVRETLPGGKSYVILADPAGPEPGGEGSWVVPPGRYFFLGDNRDNSLDSRFPTEIGVGLVPAENLEGRAELVLVSWRAGASLFKPWTWARLDPERFLKGVK